MDTDLPDDSDYEPSENENGVTRFTHDGERRGSDGDLESLTTNSVDLSLAAALKDGSKWERLQSCYNDHYLELSRETYETEENANAYEVSQVGAVTWSVLEKVRLFDSLPKVGRHNLPRLAESVKTKSLLEVKSYLDLLQGEEIDRQMFLKNTRNISQADVPAAVEIGPNCEARLEQAADALLAFQEHYDLTVAQQTTHLPGIITPKIALQLDEKSDEAVDRISSTQTSEAESSAESKEPHELFKLSTLLELSEKIFMNASENENEDDWTTVAEEGERPGITMPVIGELYQLVISLAQRLVQTSIFLTQSRLRASTNKHHKPRQDVTPEDVLSALRVLKMKHEPWEFWTRLPRRRGFRVISGSKRKGDSANLSLSYDEVEAALSIRHFSGRRRSLSVMSGVSSTRDEDSEEPSPDTDDTEDDLYHSESDDSVEMSSAPNWSEAGSPARDRYGDERSSRAKQGPPRLSTHKRKRMLEDELDEYLETMDQQDRRNEEARILRRLGIDDAPKRIKEEEIELGRRPKVLRKTVEEVKVWTPAYLSEWETYPRSNSQDVDDPVASVE